MTLSHFLRNLFFIAIIICSAFNTSSGQQYYMYTAYKFLKIELNQGLCECEVTDIAPIAYGFGGMTFTPEGDLYYLWWNLPNVQTLIKIDTLTGYYSEAVMAASNLPVMRGLIGVGNGIFYTVPDQTIPPPQWTSDSLYRWDVNTQTVTIVGETGYPGFGEMCNADGQIFELSYDPYDPPYVTKVVRVDLDIPPNSNELVSYPVNLWLGPGVSASPICNTLVLPDGINQNLVTISLIDGAINTLCSLQGYFPTGYGGDITSHLELHPNSDCTLFLDLDCNDSSGATQADYNGPSFNCLSGGSGIADDDIKLIYDSRITEMKIEVVGFVPDAPKEILDINGANPNINVSGIGTDVMTLTDGGGAISTDFKNALRNIVYRDNALLPTPGLRTITVYFTTESGQTSNVATAFINVTAIPPLVVDLGPDREACDGESVTFDAGHPGAIYTWSTGQHTQTIDASESGQYIVNVSDGLHCPTEDTVELDIIPIINVSLTGDSTGCDNESVNLLIQTDTPFSLNVEISADPGTPIIFPNVDGDFSFTDLPTESTTYTITNVTPSQDACIELIDSVHVIEVFTSYSQAVDVSICSGDSAWLGLFWETDAGIYENAFNTLQGCDSVVTTNLIVLPAIHLTQSSTTCDSASAGVFVTFLNNPNGCDTMVTTTVTLLPSDTTLINLLSCNISNVGTTTQTLTNQSGCDSLIITTTSWIPPSDTTMLNQTTCDSSLLGVFPQFLIAQNGCDSIVITTVTMAPSDTTYLSGISCDSASIGVFQKLLSNQMGCDSVVITITTYMAFADTTLIFRTSCDSSSLGVTEIHFTSIHACDSVVITSTTYSAQDSTFLTSASCDTDEVGYFVEILQNQFGCDSIVTTTVSLLPSSESFISSSTCDPSATGNFDHMLVNQFGCDSIVHETVLLLPSSTTFLSSTTCTSSQAGIFVTTLQNQYGCDSIVTLTVSLIPADTTQLISGTCDPAQVGSTQNAFTNQDGCDSLVIQTTSLFPLPQVNVQATSDFNGYDISCFGESDGSAIANVTGVSPFQYLWSTGQSGSKHHRIEQRRLLHHHH